MLAMRLHANLLAHRVGTRAVGLAYDPKVTAHFCEVGRASACLALDSSEAALDEALDAALTASGPDLALARRVTEPSMARVQRSAPWLAGSHRRSRSLLPSPMRCYRPSSDCRTASARSLPVTFPTIVSFYCGDRYYHDAAARLRADCENLGLPHDIEEMKPPAGRRLVADMSAEGALLRPKACPTRGTHPLGRRRQSASCAPRTMLRTAASTSRGSQRDLRTSATLTRSTRPAFGCRGCCSSTRRSADARSCST